MPHFTVDLGLVLNENYTVEANDADDAEEKAKDLFRDAYVLPHEGYIVVDCVELTDPDDGQESLVAEGSDGGVR